MKFSYSLPLLCLCITTILGGCGDSASTATKHFEAGLALIEEDKLAEAEQEFKAALESDQGFARAHVELGKLHQAGNVLDKALEAYEKALEIDPELAEAQLRTGEIRLLKGEFQRAIRTGEELLSGKSSVVEANTLIGKAHVALWKGSGASLNIEQAVQAFERAHQAAPESADPLIALGNVLIKSGDVDKAEAIFEQVIETIDKDNALAALGLSEVYRLRGDTAKGTKALERTLTSDPTDIRARLSLAMLNLEGGQFEEAVKNANIVLMKDNKNALAFYIRGSALLDLGSTGQALRDLEFAVDAAPTFPDAFQRLAEAYMLIGRDDLAITPLERHALLRPSSPKANVSLAELYLRQGMYDAALEQCGEALAAVPKSSEAWTLKGLTEITLGRRMDALKSFEMVEEITRKDPATLASPALVALARGDFDTALDKALDSVARNDDVGETFNVLGLVYERRGDMDDALDSFRRALEKDPGLAPARANLSKMYVKAGGNFNAVKIFQSWLQTNRADSFAQLALAELYMALGLTESALDEYEKLLKTFPNNIEALIGKADALVESWEYGRAVAAAFEAVKIAPQNFRTHASAATALRARGEFERAATEWVRAAGLRRNFSEDMLNAALAYLASGNYAKAEAALKLTPQNRPIELLAATSIATARGRTKEATVLMNTAVAMGRAPSNLSLAMIYALMNAGEMDKARKRVAGPGFPSGLRPLAKQTIAISADSKMDFKPSILGLLFLEAGWNAKAEELFKKALDTCEADAVLHEILGRLYRGEGKFAKAEGSFRKVIELCGEAEKTQWEIVHVLKDRYGPEKAVSPCEKGLKLFPESIEGRLLLASLFEKSGAIDLAVASYEKALEARPDNITALKRLATITAHNPESAARASELAAKAVETDPDDSEAHRTLGLNLLLKDNVNGAIAEIEKALELDPYDLTARYLRGVALIKDGKQDEGIRDLETVIDLNPDFPEAGDARTKLAMLKKDKETSGRTPHVSRPRAVVNR
ncbi:tetratricopeptide repeat protein [Candidatus Hydrogenedentota bacterium]